MIPQTLGKYQLIKKIAAGGMAEIYLARVKGLAGFEKNVVVKRILPQLATDNQFIQMFLDEARIAATLQHPNIVQMYDIGAADGNYFISMEYLHGEDVRSIMRRLIQRNRSLSIDQALAMTTGVSAGLHYAHEKRGFDGTPLGIVHRDVTPQNVIVTYDGGVKLVDFGIAKATNRLNETRYGTLKGKIPYMSPEQCQGKPLDRRSDVFAIGIMLYELTTTSRLYRGQSDFEIMKLIVEHPVIPPSQRREGYPAELEQIVMKALEKEPEDRYQSAQELQVDLEAFAREHRSVVSAIALSSFMHELFADRISAFQEVSGDEEQLAEHLATKLESGRYDSAVEELDPDDPHAITRSEPHSSASLAATPTGRGQLERAGDETGVDLSVPRRPWGRAAAVVGLLALLGAGVLVARGLSSGESSSSSAAPAAAIATSTDAGAGAMAVADAAAEAPPTIGAARIESTPAGADISLDGAAHGTTPALLDELAPGSHTVRLSMDGHEPATHTFEITAGETATVALALEPSAPARTARRPARGASDAPRRPPAAARPTGTGELRIASRPSCEVIIGGRAYGQTPLAGIKLAAGRHRVQLVNSRFGIDRSYTIVIKPGEVLKKSYTFPIEDQR